MLVCYKQILLGEFGRTEKEITTISDNTEMTIKQ